MSRTESDDDPSAEPRPEERKPLPLQVVAGGCLILVATLFLGFLLLFGIATGVMVTWYMAFLATLSASLGYAVARRAADLAVADLTAKSVLFSLLISFFALPLWILYYVVLVSLGAALAARMALLQPRGPDPSPVAELARGGMILSPVAASAAALAAPFGSWSGLGIMLIGLGATWAFVGLEMVFLAREEMKKSRSLSWRFSTNRAPFVLAVAMSALATLFVIAAPILGFLGRTAIWTGLLITSVVVPGAVGAVHLFVWASTMRHAGVNSDWRPRSGA